MSKVLFSKTSILKLQKNKNVLNISEKAITYTDEFKRLFIDEYMSGKLPRGIFKENGFDVDIIGMKRIEQSACRWKAMYKANGIVGLTDTRKGLSGRFQSNTKVLQKCWRW